MRNRPLIFTVLLVFALLLSACASGNQNGEPVGTIFPTDDGTGTLEIPETGATAAPTVEVMDSTPTMAATEAATMPATETATEAATETTQPTEEPTAAATTAVAPTLDATGTPGAGETPSAGAGDSIIGIPQTGVGGLAGLAAMFDFRVVGSGGEEIGTVQDYILNTCEANILYIVVDPAEGVGSSAGQQVLIPYQATFVTPNNGQVNALEREFVIDLTAADLSGAPSVNLAGLDMENVDWETDVISFWKTQMELSLTSGCPVPVSGRTGDSAAQTTATPDAMTTATPAADSTSDRQVIHQIAQASQALSANLQDGNGMLLGTVVDIAIVPETGHTQFLLVELSAAGQDESRLVALPPGAVNISYEMGADQPVFVLLVETSVLYGVPDYDITTNMTDESWFSYWEAYVPMTLEQLP